LVRPELEAVQVLPVSLERKTPLSEPAKRIEPLVAKH